MSAASQRLKVNLSELLYIEVVFVADKEVRVHVATRS
jgi:hypothetical protein